MHKWATVKYVTTPYNNRQFRFIFLQVQDGIDMITVRISHNKRRQPERTVAAATLLGMYEERDPPSLALHSHCSRHHPWGPVAQGPLAAQALGGLGSKNAAAMAIPHCADWLLWVGLYLHGSGHCPKVGVDLDQAPQPAGQLLAGSWGLKALITHDDGAIVAPADLEGQLQLMSKGVQGSQGTAGQQHTAHMHARQLAHAHSRREAPV
ncbi:MAG: hypothetical protein FRX49_06314 [Trebouxia sp. A1-2]|nr:MAG: hypothetical protein FRX49_06314 [Trebouxia sp. A1-2]